MMGCFSWKDCNSDKPIKIGDTCYLLIPKEFGGGYIKELSYDGYGHFGYCDVYEEVLEWNKNFDNTKCVEKPELNQYGGLYSFEKEQLLKEGLSEEEVSIRDNEQRNFAYQGALKMYENTLRYLEEYKNGAVLKADILRELGIAISCDDWQNKQLTYPIKICKTPAVYEECPYSKTDPFQGCD